MLRAEQSGARTLGLIAPVRVRYFLPTILITPMNILRLNLILLVVIAAGTQLTDAMAQSSVAQSSGGWNRFHGSEGAGDAGDAMLPAQWTDADYRWRRKLGSRDVGSPIVIDGKVYYLVSKPDSRQLAVESLDLSTGKLRWTREFPLGEYRLHARNTYAASTPAADEQNVFIAFADSQHTYLKCLDHDGNEIWSRDFGSWQSQHGFGTSPRIYGDVVLMLNSQQAEELGPGEKPGSSRMIAVDRASGRTVWETPLTATKACYGVPAVFRGEQGDQVISADTADGMFGLDPSTGKKLWNLKVFDMRVCSTPLITGDLAICSSGSGGGGNHLVAVRIPTRRGQSPEQVYRIESGAPYVPTPVLRGQRLFMVDDKGIASCIDVRTSESLWLKRIGGNFGASPIVVGDKMLIISLDGQATVLRASDRFEVLGEMNLGGTVGATPAFAEGCLLLRVDDELRCLGSKSAI